MANLWRCYTDTVKSSHCDEHGIHQGFQLLARWVGNGCSMLPQQRITGKT
jgi:hypothetical protein